MDPAKVCFICCSGTKPSIKCHSCHSEEQCVQCILSQFAQVNDLDTLDKNLTFQCAYCREESSFDVVISNVIPKKLVKCPLDVVVYNYSIVGKRGVLSRKRKLNDENSRVLSCGWTGSPNELEKHLQKCKLVPFTTAIQHTEENDLFFVFELYVKLGRVDLFEMLLRKYSGRILSQADSFQPFHEAMSKWPTSRILIWSTFGSISRGTLLFFIHTGLFEEVHQTFGVFMVDIKLTHSVLEACSVIFDFLRGHDSLEVGKVFYLSWFRTISQWFQVEEHISDEILLCQVKAAHTGLRLCNLVCIPNTELGSFIQKLMFMLQDYRVTMKMTDAYDFLHPLPQLFMSMDFSDTVLDGYPILNETIDTLFSKTTSLPLKLNLFDIVTLMIRNHPDERLVSTIANYLMEKITTCYQCDLCIDPRDIFNVDDRLSTEVVVEFIPIYIAAKNFARYLSHTPRTSRSDADDYVNYLIDKFSMFIMITSLLSPDNIVTQCKSILSLINMKILELCIAIRKYCETRNSNHSTDNELTQKVCDFLKHRKEISWNEITLMQILITFSAPVFQKETLIPHSFEHQIARRHINFLRSEHLRSELLVTVKEEIDVVYSDSQVVYLDDNL